jgi:CRISPR-associated protein Csx14
MSNPDPSIRVKVDVTNPGQFFACCGLLELADRLWPGAEGWFEGEKFHIYRDNEPLPKEAIAELVAVGMQLTAEVVPSDRYDLKVAPIRIPSVGLQLDWWLSLEYTPTRFKTWAANASSCQMYSKWLGSLSKVESAIRERPEALLDIAHKIQGSYGFDAQLGWHAIDVGFSLNEHPALKQLPLRPAVELFGALGLQRFLPLHNRSNDEVQYCIWSTPLAVAIAAPAAKGVFRIPGITAFRTTFVKRGSFKGLDFATPIGDQL